jgi:hypothetical protein
MRRFRVMIQGEDGRPFGAVWRGEGGEVAARLAFGERARIVGVVPLD